MEAKRPELSKPEAIAPSAGLDLRVGPNPFNPSTQVSFRLESAAFVEARVYDIAGRVVRTLADAPLPPGDHRLLWDGRDSRGATASSGVYFLRLRAGAELHRIKLILAK